MGTSINVERVDHAGIRVKDPARALKFYRMLGFEVMTEVEFDPVIIIRNSQNVEINLVVNAAGEHDGSNILMDVDTKYAGITHLALRVSSIVDTISVLKENDVPITQGPVMFGRDGHVSVFVRDPDRNVIELRAHAEHLDEIEGVNQYENIN
ncbi:MAG: VOC family protein [Pseudomonadota bacterium]|nr:VOC family protein [Pseudomonadota bacterium]